MPAVLALAGIAVLVSLGNWQLRRLAWKEDLIARVSERPNAPAEALPPASAWPTLDIAASEYRPFRLTGRFLDDKQALVFTSIPDPHGRYGGPGYWVVTPFALADGGTVLVNRGFVPQERVDAITAEESAGGPQTVTGLLRPDEERGFFTPADQPQKNLFYARAIAPIAAAKGLSGALAPFTIDLVASETPPGGLPQSGETRMVFPNDHLQYALTWYGLAAALLAVFVAYAWRRIGAGGGGAA